MNRIDRISAILIQLQTRRVIKAQDIADRFEISLRTVYRDIRSLEEAGVPIIGEAGIGYSLVEGYRLPPVMFTRDEASAFLTAEKLVAQLTDASTSADYSSAMYKIKAVLKSSEKEYLEDIESSIAVLKSKRQENSALELNLLQTTLKSIAEKRAMTIKYFTHYSQESNERCVEPVGVFFLDTYWHLIAFCRLRNDYRDFRLDRISDLRLSNQLFSRQHPPLKEYLQFSCKEKNLHEVVIRVSKNWHAYLDNQKYYNGFISEVKDGDETEMTFMTTSITGFARWYMMFGDEACIKKPDILVETVRSMLSNIAERLTTTVPEPVL
ncbi:helix-turn-helix transcriptional regulator [Desertivirga xinjiangensis]|uniref:helix-turn-helix transcriptional regulator n=1 Tax=Desertivirga xinjiangensis TaxID=539206 RepID=UPI00210D38E7|nr:YafY family protein [Pedobacter xinjiangensis]